MKLIALTRLYSNCTSRCEFAGLRKHLNGDGIIETTSGRQRESGGLTHSRLDLLLRKLMAGKEPGNETSDRHSPTKDPQV